MARNFNNASTTSIEHYLGATYEPPITLSAWIRPSVINVNDTYLSFNVGTIAEALGTSLQIFVNSSNNFNVRSATQTSASDQANTATTVAANTWYHVAGCFASSTSRICYVDGVASATGTTSRVTQGLEYLIIGRGSGQTYDPVRAANGQVAEVAVWDADLNADEIVSLSKGLKPMLVRPSKLIAYLPLVRDIYDAMSSQAPTVSATTVVDHPRRIA